VLIADGLSIPKWPKSVADVELLEGLSVVLVRQPVEGGLLLLAFPSFLSCIGFAIDFGP